MILVAAWARAFALALVVEGLVAAPLLGRGHSLARRAGAVVLGQLVTHPLVWFVFSALPLSRGWYLAIAEGWAVAGEAMLYSLVFPNLSLPRVVAVSALANAASFAAGAAMREFTSWF